jgi:hypothetical protein
MGDNNHGIFDKGMFNSIVGWTLVITATVVVCAVALHYYHDADTDPDALLRAMLLRIPMMAVGIMMLLGSLIAASLIIPGDGLHLIGEDPRAMSIMMAALLLAVSIVCAYS